MFPTTLLQVRVARVSAITNVENGVVVAAGSTAAIVVFAFKAAEVFLDFMAWSDTFRIHGFFSRCRSHGCLRAGRVDVDVVVATAAADATDTLDTARIKIFHCFSDTACIVTIGIQQCHLHGAADPPTALAWLVELVEGLMDGISAENDIHGTNAVTSSCCEADSAAITT